MIDSVCNECVSRCYIPERIAIDPADSYPAEEWCEEDSNNFQTEDGCYRFSRRKNHEQTR